MISLHGFQKPLAGRRGVARNQIQQNMNAALMGLDEQALQILVCAIAWRYGIEILDIIASIHERRFEARIQPNPAKAHFCNIVQLFDNSGNITNTICIGILKTLWIDLIKNTIT